MRKSKPALMLNQRFFAGIRDIVGGRSGAYEKELRKAARNRFSGTNRFFLKYYYVLLELYHFYN
ncbi:hypothetical protein K732_10295 [Salmonella enterica subsp. enterica serovar Saintpaul str. S-70]|nr:hypothetical protein K732_10295 [Salmonella enterica subsp. enterica serovar Saintpaul str. S-70]